MSFRERHKGDSFHLALDAAEALARAYCSVIVATLRPRNEPREGYHSLLVYRILWARNGLGLR